MALTHVDARVPSKVTNRCMPICDRLGSDIMMMAPLLSAMILAYLETNMASMAPF